MKKIISLMLAFVLVFGCVFALVSCKGDDEETENKATTPTTDPDKVLNYFLSAGFEAEYTTDLEYVSNYGMDGLIGVFEAENDNGVGVYDAMFIFYFESEEARKAADSAIDALFSRFEMQAVEIGMKLITGKDGKMAWFGTENAIKISAGIKVDGPGNGNVGGEVGGDPNDGPGADVGGDDVGNDDNKDDPNAPEAIPMDNYFDLYTYLGDLGYTVHRECVDYGADFSSWGMPGIQAYLLSINPESKETIEIYYFDTAENADKSYEKIYGFFEDFMEETKEDGKEFIYVIEKYENMVWIGTESTIRVAEGK